MEKGIAIHIGVNSPGDCTCNRDQLLRCVSAAQALADLTSGRFKHFGSFLGRARRDDVKNAIREANRQLAPGGILLLTFAGHGCQVQNRSALGQPDGLDESWCLSDKQMIDDELEEVLADFTEDKRVVIISESCHAAGIVGLLKDMLDHFLGAARKLFQSAERGNGTWGAVYGPRDSIPDVSDLEIKKKHVSTNIRAQVLLLAACREKETSEDGLFTRTLLDLMKGDDPPQSYAALIRHAHDRIFPKRPRQKPGWAFDSALLAHRPFEIDP